jgi:predicted amidohydrolase YtcJ
MRERHRGNTRRKGRGFLRSLFFLTPALLLGVAGACDPMASPEEAADLILVNGKVVTLDPELGEAQAVAVKDGRIVTVGTNPQVRDLIGRGTEVIDLEGRLAIPGFIEGHGHYLGFGQSLTILRLGEARTWDEIVEMVAEAAREAEPGQWIAGRGWHQEDWDPPPARTVQGVPTHHELSAVSPDNPVILTHASGHASFVNARALEVAEIDRDTPDPDGGTIVRDDDGEATGYLRQAAQGLARQARARTEDRLSPEEEEARFRLHAELAGEQALAHGVTSFHDAGSSFAAIDGFRNLADEGALPVRMYVMVRGETHEAMAERLPDYRLIGYGDHFLTVRSIKTQIDGALGTHGAWLLEPYEDLPTSSGLPQRDPDDIRRTGEVALEHGFQVNTHAIGDRGNREVLDVYEELYRQAGESPDLRWRIEHAQHLHPDDIPRFGEIGVIASMQGIHATSDGPWVPPRLGEWRSRTGAYAWRSLIDSGAVICNGTDVPVEPISAIASYYASVSRMMANGERFFPEQAMTRMEALESYTINCAWAAFMDDDLGTLTPGKLGDIVVLDRDILTIPEEEIVETQVDLTIVGGEVRYRR